MTKVIEGTLGRIVAVGLLLAGLAGAPALAADKLTVVAGKGGGHANALAVGLGKGFFEAEGLDVTLINPTTGDGIISAVASGEGNVAIGTLNPSFFNIAKNGDLVLLGGAALAKPGYAQVVLVAAKAAYEKGFKGAADLPGKTIGVAGLTGSSYYQLYLMAEKYHFGLDKVNVKSLGSDANVVAAVAAGSIDGALLGQEVFARPLVKSGDGIVIVRTTGETGDMLASVVFTNSKYLATRRDMLVRFLRAYVRSAGLYSETFANRDARGELVRTPQADELLAILSKYVGAPVDDIVATLGYITPDASVDVKEVDKQLAAWTTLKMVDPGIQAGKFVDPSVLQSAKAK